MSATCAGLPRMRLKVLKQAEQKEEPSMAMYTKP